MWKVTVKEILSRKVRFLLTGVAVMLGVAFVSGTLVLTATIGKTFDNLFADIYKHTDAAVREKSTFKGNFDSGRGRVGASVLSVVRSASGVAHADGTVQGYARIIDKRNKALGNPGRGAPTFGFAYIRDRDLSTFHVVSGRGPRAANEIVIDKKTANDTGYKVGDSVPVLTKEGRADYKLTGVVKFGTADSPLGATIVAFPPTTASRVLAQPGKFDSIAVKARSGVSQTQVARSIERALQARSQRRVEVLTGKQITTESQNNLKDNLAFFNTFLLLFGAVSLLVGSFIIFNTFSILVAQRNREMALLRAIGATRRQVLGSVLFEAVLVGVTASIVGFLGGIVLAGGLKALLAALGIDIPATAITIPASAVIASFVVGLVVTTVAAVAPALRASRVPPIAALRDMTLDFSSTSLRRIAAGLVVTGVGTTLLLFGLFGSGALALMGLGAVVVFLGVAILGPVVARPVARALGAPIRGLRGVTGTIAQQNAMRNPKRTSSTAAALMIGVALVGFITIFGASARASVSSAIDKSMKADYIIDSGQFRRGGFPLTLEQQLRSAKGVLTVSGIRSGAFKVKGSVSELIAVDPKVMNSLFDLQVTRGTIRALGADGLAVQKNTASDHGWKVGSKIRVQFPSTGSKVLAVRAIYKQTDVGSYVASHQAFAQNYPDQFDTQIYVKTAGGETAANRASLQNVLQNYPGGKLQDRSQFKASQRAQINQLLNLVYVLLFFAIVIALFGIANTLGLSIIERTRELGLLRAVGMMRQQVRSTVRWESVIIALLGTFLGLAIAVIFASAVVSALSSQGIDKLTFAPLQLLVVVVLAAAFGVLAAIWPARKAAKLDVLHAITTE